MKSCVLNVRLWYNKKMKKPKENIMVDKLGFKNRILKGDTIEELQNIPNEIFDFCFADPPYFLQIEKNKKLYRTEGTEFSGCNDTWDQFESMDVYKNWTKSWLSEVRRTLKPNGTVCVISGMQSVYEIGNILRELGFWVINDIVWNKSNPTPNFGGTRLNNSHETLIWAKKSKDSKFTFNYKTGKFLNGGKQMGSVWTFPVCSGNERLRDENNQKVHSTQKPEALLYRIIALFTKKGDLVLDPFGGTMTTGVVAKRMGRNYTLIERDERYIRYGSKRLESVEVCIGDVENAIFDKKPIKVSMEEMISNKCFIVGERFYVSDNGSAVLYNSKGQLEYDKGVYSMHEVAAKLLGRSRRVNGFDYFSVKRDGRFVSINEIRENYRKTLEGCHE